MSTDPVSDEIKTSWVDCGGVNSPHLVQFYEDDHFLVDSMADHLGEGLKAGDGAVIVASRPHREAIEARLSANGFDLAKLSEQGRFVSADAHETLAKICLDDFPNVDRFADAIGRTFSRTNGASPNRFTRAFGEMVAIQWAQGRRDAALHLEGLWNELQRKLNFSLFCAYPINSFSSALDGDYLLKVCAAHSDVVPAESFSRLGNERDRQRSIAYLQQKAALLESEMAQRKRIEEELRNRIDELAESDRRKNEFLAMLGHELRNPLSAMLNAITAADLDESSRDRAIDIARRQTIQLARLVDDLLDVARITQGRISLRKEPIGVVSLVERSIEETRAAAELRRQRLTVVTPPDTHTICVDVDPARMQQSISNVIHNAIKFTQTQGRIEVSLRRQGANVAIRIRDSGIGIAPEVLPRVFDLFAQGNVSIDRSQGGLGVGLTLVRRLVSMHGGNVEAHSAGIGKGSEFEIILPILDDSNHTAPIDSKPDVQKTSRVLVVEDNRDAAESLQMLLELFGHEVQVAEDAFRALEILREDSFHALIIDIGLPRMDGYALAGRIRALPKGRSMRLIALTGYGQDDDRRRSLSAGFDQHLVKPVDIDRLQEILAQASQRTATSVEPFLKCGERL
jgi:signal transduction histidine kinase/ActR/RegA family two-component response regulator